MRSIGCCPVGCSTRESPSYYDFSILLSVLSGWVRRLAEGSDVHSCANNISIELKVVQIQIIKCITMIDVEKKSIKTVEDYRHSIKLLKYHLKKQKKVNQKLQYEAAKSKHRPQTQATRNRVYELTETVKIISDRLKRMGLILEDVFRMCDCNYEGEINKQQFLKVVSKLKTDLNDMVFMEMFFAIDTSLNGLISEDQFLQFSIAYGGCSDPKLIRKFQSQTKSKLIGLITKKYGTIQKFLENYNDPAPIHKLSSEFKNLGLNGNQQMIMMKTFDPSHTGAANHKIILEIMASAKFKTDKEKQSEQLTQSVNELCVLFRDSKINPIIIFEEADVDGTEGVSPFELEQAFKKVLKDKANSYQIKKWISLINFNNDNQISKEEYLNSIRGFYTINQLSNFSKQNEAKHPEKKKLGVPQPETVEATLRKLSIAIEDKGMTKKQAYHSIDFNHEGGIDQQELLLGLKSLGIDIGLIGNVLAVFDADNTKSISLEEWLKVLGADEQLSDVPMVDSGSDVEAQKKKKEQKPAKKPINKAATNKPGEKGVENKIPNKISKQNPSPEPRPMEKSQSKNTKNPQKENGKKIQENQKQKIPEKTSTLKKKDTISESKKIETEKQSKISKPASVQKKKFAEDNQSIKFSKIQGIQSKGSINGLKKKESQIQMKKVESIEYDNIEAQIDQVEQKIAIAYKKSKSSFLKNFKEYDKNSKGFVNMKSFNEVMKKLDSSIPANYTKELFMKHCTNGNEFRYSDWLEQISDMYAQQVEEQEKEQQEQEQEQVHDEVQEDEHEESLPNQSEIKGKSKKRTEGQDIDNQLINKLVPLMEEDKNVKRGEKSEDFQALAKLSKPEGKRTDSGYKLFDYLSDEQGQLKGMRDEMLKKAEAVKNGKKRFEDKDFPNNQKSIIKDKSKSNIKNYNMLQWKHYQDIYKNPQLFKGEIEPSDIRQGQLGDCYFLSALAGLAEYKNLIQRLFEYYDIKNGYFLIWLCIDGNWRLVEVDGYLPIWPNGKVPAFSHSSEQQIWVCLLEKAYAKSYGDYNKIVGGQPYEAIKDLTGGPGLQFNFNKFKIDQIWQKLSGANNRQYIMTAGTKIQEMQSKVEGHQQDVTSTGIVLGHAYSILDCQEVSGERILKLRNPWGEFQWTGDDWSDKGKKWTPEMKKKLNYQINENDGIFWITLQQFYTNFMSCSINYIRPTFYYRSGKINGVQQILVSVPANQFNQGYLMACHKDHRHDGLPINTPYDGIYSLLGFIYNQKEGKVVQKFEQKKFLYEREGFVEYTKLNKYPQGSQVMLLLNLDKVTNITIGYYGDKTSDFEIQRDCIKYIEKLAFYDQNGPKAQTSQNTLKIWESSVQGLVFLCFKNLKKEELAIKVTIKQPKNLRVLPPYAIENVLKIPGGAIQSIRLKVTGNPYSYSYSIST